MGTDLKNHPFTAALRAAMTFRGISSAELSRRSNIVYSTLNDYYNGISFPDVLKLIKICEALDIPPSHLFAENKSFPEYQRFSADVERTAAKLQELEDLEPGAAAIYTDHISKWVVIARKHKGGGTAKPHGKQKRPRVDGEGKTPLNPFGS